MAGYDNQQNSAENFVRGTVFDIQRFCTHDGPGIRTTVFMKGCPLKCLWCHNPESQETKPELLFSPNICIDCKSCEKVCPRHSARAILSDELRTGCGDCLACAKECPAGAIKAVGKLMTVEQVMDEVLKDIDFYEAGEGGITISGGEPFAQSEFVIALAQKARSGGLNVCVETCGFTGRSNLEKMLPFVDLWLWDIKDTDPVRHLANTDAGLDIIMDNLKFADAAGAKTLLRCVFAAGINTDINHYSNLAKLYDELVNCKGIELLLCHCLGNSKLEQLGRTDLQPDFKPSQHQLELARSILGNRVTDIR